MEPHAIAFTGARDGRCGECHAIYWGGWPDAADRDPVHNVPGTCLSCGKPAALRREYCASCAAARVAALDAERAEARKIPVTLPDPDDIPDLTDDERDAARSRVDMSPEAVAARKAAKAREVEAVAWVREYTGTWGLPLDIRANPKWGTKYLRLTEKQVDALLKGKARDTAYAASVATIATDPLAVWLKGQHGSGFLGSVGDQARAGRPLSPRQLEVAQRIMNEQAARLEAPEALVEATEVTEGIYRDPATETIWKCVIAHHGSGRLYAQRLIVHEGTKASFEYDAGAIRRIRPEWRMTLDQAVEFGQLYGICCNCGRILTDSTSIEQGIGPICRRKFA